MVRAEALVKTYGKVTALKGVSLHVQPGEIFGLIGPDGAGKTTLFRILTTLLLADRGSARVAGLDAVKDYRRIRSRIGYMPGRFSLYQDLTVRENLEFFASVFRTTVRENYDIIRDIYGRLEPFRDRRAGALSGGMKQKLALSCALIHRPEVLFLDEPTTGVDPVSRREFWEILKTLKAQGITILVSTPYMDEAGLCGRIALISRGEILVTDTPGGITARYDRPLWSVKGPDMYRLLGEIREIPGIRSCYAFGASHHVSPESGGPSLEELEARLVSRGFSGVEVRPEAPGVEDCFLELLGGGTRG